MDSKFVFFIEGIEHERFIAPYIKFLKKYSCKIEIYSFEKLTKNYVNDENFYIINKSDLIKFCLNLECNYFLTTTPGIGNLYFPKSKVLPKKNRPKYIYLFHSLVSPNEVYSEKSFKGFDVIFSPNLIISDQLKYVTSKNCKIFTIGYPIISNLNNLNYKEKKNKVLIAPSWGPNSLFRKTKLLEQVIFCVDKNFEIILRPHPMELKNIDFLKNNKKVSIDLNKNLSNLHEYKFLITDWSGIGIEFSAINKTKVIYLDLPKKVNRKLTKKEKSLDLIENVVRSRVGIVLKDNELDYLNKLDDQIEYLSFNKIEYLDELTSPAFNLKIFYNYVISKN